MIKILLLNLSPDGAVSYYRTMGPLNHLRKAYRGEFQIELMQPGEIFNPSWAKIQSCDVFIMSRPYKREHVMFLEHVSNCKVPSIIDYDDDLLNVPPENPNFFEFQNCRDSIKASILLSSMVTVSTEAIKKSFSELQTGNFRVIPNALDISFMGKLKRPPHNENIIFWRGSDTHQKDVAEIKDSLSLIAHENPDWKFFFAGAFPWGISDLIPPKQMFAIKPSDMIMYLHSIQTFQPKIFINPLCDNAFNRAKSNISWLEATSCDAVTVAPTLPEFNRTGIINYATTETRHETLTFYDALSFAIQSRTYREEMKNKSWADVQENFALDNVNMLRRNLLKEITC